MNIFLGNSPFPPSVLAADESGPDADVGLKVTKNHFIQCFAAGHELIKIGQDSSVLTTQGTLKVRLVI